MANIQRVIAELYADPARAASMRPFTRLDDPGVSCKPGRPRDRLTFGQSVVHEYCKMMAEPGSRRGLLVLHSTGSGKTCVAAAVMDAFAATDRSFVYVTSVAGLRSNPPEKFDSCSRELFGVLPDPKRVHFLSFAQLAHALSDASSLNERRRKYLRRAVLIIDEVHRLFHPLPNQTAEHNQLLDFLLGGGEGFDLKVIIMTATPGDDPDEVVKLLNIVRDRGLPPLRVPSETKEDEREFLNDIDGLVSYLDLSRDIRLYPRVEERDVDVVMAPEHFRTYDLKSKAAPEGEQDYDSLMSAGRLEKYLRTARKYANAMFEYTPEREVTEFSAKIARLLETIEKHPREKHYVYSAFYENRGYGGHGVRAIGNLLTGMGYEQMTPQMVAAGRPTPEPKRRFMYLITTELGGDDSEARQAENVKAMVDFYNSAANKDGRYVQIILASQGFNESIDLASVRHIHLLEPLVNYAKHVQATGRAARLCSHQQLGDEFGDWKVLVHNYISRGPPDPMRIVDVNKVVRSIDALDVLTYHNPGRAEDLLREREGLVRRYETALAVAREARDTVDQRIRDEARVRYKEMDRMQRLLAAAAIDCLVTSRFHGHDFRCSSEAP